MYRLIVGDRLTVDRKGNAGGRAVADRSGNCIGMRHFTIADGAACPTLSLPRSWGDEPTSSSKSKAAMTALLVLTCVLAFVIPVRVATRVDPIAAIRHE